MWGSGMTRMCKEKMECEESIKYTELSPRIPNVYGNFDIRPDEWKKSSQTCIKC